MTLGRKLDRLHLAIAGIVVAAVFLVAINVAASGLLRGLALDLTQGNLFTLSDGTRKVLSNIREPITLRLFYSPQLGEAFPVYGAYAIRVRELLERYKSLADGMIRLEVYAPEPFSDDEDQAVSFGMNGITINEAGDVAYLGIAGANSTDDEKTIPFLHLDRDRFLEYDLTRMVSELANPEKRVVGLITALPLEGSPANPMLGPAGGGQPPWMITQEIRHQFALRQVDPESGTIEDDVDVLLVVHPKGLSDKALYAIDQYVMRGGRAMIFVDPHAEADRPANPMLMIPGGSASNLDKLLEAWGVEVSMDKVVGDKNAAIRVTIPSQSGRGSEVAEYLAWLSLDEANINHEDVVTADLSRMIFASSGDIHRKADSTLSVEPLVTSSNEAMEIEADKVRIVPDPSALWADFKPSGETYVLAARLSGTAKSAFPDGPPKAEDEQAENSANGDESEQNPDEDAQDEDADTEAAKAAHIAESAGSINVILVADTDLLRDQFWVQVRDFFGQQIAVRTSSNADFVMNGIENLTGSEALIGLRSRGESARPFDMVRSIQQEAEERYRRQEQELATKLSETEKKLSELQTSRGQDGEFILTSEQEQAIDEFRSQMVVIRKELRGVQLALRQDIDRLDAWLKFINIGLIPILIGVFAVVLGFIRRARRRRAAQASV